MTVNNISKRAKILIVSGITISLALLLIGGIWYWREKTQNQSTPSVSQNETRNLPNDCPYLNEAKLTTRNPKRKYSQLTLYEKDLPQWRQIPSEFIVSGWEKSYHWHDILQLWKLKLLPAEIPDLKAQQRVGVINSLAYSLGVPGHILEDETISKEKLIQLHEEGRFGCVNSLVVIMRKVTGRGKINLGKGISGTSCWGNTQKYVRKLINFTLNQENLNPDQYEIFLLSCIGTEQPDEIHASNATGKSLGSAVYLTLLSALHQKPIAKSIAATGMVNTSNKARKAKVNEQEINLVPGDNLPIAGLKGKLYAAVEKGVDCLVLSSYNTTPNLLGYYIGDKHITKKWGWTEDYSKVVPSEIREKLTVFWTKNISELRELLFQGKLS